MNKLTIDVIKPIILICFMFELEGSSYIPVYITDKPIKGIINKDNSNI